MQGNPLTAALKTVAHEGTPSIQGDLGALSKYQPKLLVDQEAEMHNYRMHGSNGNFLQQMENLSEVLFPFTFSVPISQRGHNHSICTKFPFFILLSSWNITVPSRTFFDLQTVHVERTDEFASLVQREKKSWKYSIISNQNF